MLLNQTGIKINEEKPDKISCIDDEARFCEYVGRAREGSSFCLTVNNISCPLARYNLGLEEHDKQKLEELARTLVSWGDADNRKRALNYLQETPVLDYGEKYISVFPLDMGIKRPDLVILFMTPDKLMPLAREVAKKTGDWNSYYMSGVGGMCAEVTAIPMVTGKLNFSLGCGGSRPHGRLEEDQLLSGLPYDTYNKYSSIINE